MPKLILVDIYDYEVTLLPDSFEQAGKCCALLGIEWPEHRPSHGRSWVGATDAYIWINPTLPRNVWLQTAMHECIHVALKIANNIGLSVEAEEEAFCWLADYVFKGVIE